MRSQHVFNGRGEFLVEPYQVEGVAHLDDTVKFLLRHDLAMGPPTSSPIGYFKPRLAVAAEVVGEDASEERLVGRVRSSRFIRTQMRGNRREQPRILGEFARRFGPIAHEPRRMGEKKAHPAY